MRKWIKRRKICLIHLESRKLLKNILTNYLADKSKELQLRRALSNTPLLILADEPTGNLDSKSSAAVIESFLLAKEKMNATILMVTHDAIAASYADRVVALSDGKIVKELLRTVEPRQFMNEILDFLKVVEVSR